MGQLPTRIGTGVGISNPQNLHSITDMYEMQQGNIGIGDIQQWNTMIVTGNIVTKMCVCEGGEGSPGPPLDPPVSKM